MNTSTVQADEAAIARPKYYEMDGALRANANRAWLLAFLTIPIALVATGFAIFVRMQPPTVIRIGPNGDASVLGKPAKGAVSDLATGGTDEFLDEAFVKRFLTSYLNYSPTDVDDHWAGSLNMMTRNLRAYTLKAMGTMTPAARSMTARCSLSFICVRSMRFPASRSRTWSTA